jgi:Tfp pilus assembly protein FimT
MPLLYLGSFISLTLGPLAAPALAVATTAAPTVTDPASATSVATSSYSIKGTVGDASPQDINVYQDVNNNGSIDSGTDTVVASGLSLNDKSFSVSTPLSLGANNFLVTATMKTQY